MLTLAIEMRFLILLFLVLQVPVTFLKSGAYRWFCEHLWAGKQGDIHCVSFARHSSWPSHPIPSEATDASIDCRSYPVPFVLQELLSPRIRGETNFTTGEKMPTSLVPLLANFDHVGLIKAATQTASRADSIFFFDTEWNHILIQLFDTC